VEKRSKQVASFQVRVEDVDVGVQALSGSRKREPQTLAERISTVAGIIRPVLPALSDVAGERLGCLHLIEQGRVYLIRREEGAILINAPGAPVAVSAGYSVVASDGFIR